MSPVAVLYVALLTGQPVTQKELLQKMLKARAVKFRTCDMVK
jgi:hypothetical protein